MVIKHKIFNNIMFAFYQFALLIEAASIVFILRNQTVTFSHLLNKITILIRINGFWTKTTYKTRQIEYQISNHF